MLVIEFDSNIIGPSFGGLVDHLAGPIVVVLALHGCLYRALNPQSQTSLSSSLHVHCEHCRLVSQSTFQTCQQRDIRKVMATN